MRKVIVTVTAILVGATVWQVCTATASRSATLGSPGGLHVAEDVSQQDASVSQQQVNGQRKGQHSQREMTEWAESSLDPHKGEKDSLGISGSDSIGGEGEQYGRLIQELQWYSRDGERPGTYEEYLQDHPLTPAEFSEPIRYEPYFKSGRGGVSILTQAGLYPQITSGLNQYISDLQSEGYMVLSQTVSGGTPEQIKSFVWDNFVSGCWGFVFIGDITAAWARVGDAEFPCDLFYMDLNGYWGDHDGDGVYECHEWTMEGDLAPEAYVGRIYAHTLDYDSEANMVNDYLAKAHSYRVGSLLQPWRALEYIDEDWFDMDVFADLAYGGDVTHYDYGYYTTGTDYLDKMRIGQHYVQVCAHSFSGGHHFGTLPTESASYAHVYVYSPTNRNARLRLGSDDGIKVWLNGDNVYMNDRYGDWSVDDFSTRVRLNAGWNRLLCKVSQEGRGYLLSAQFTRDDFPFPVPFFDLKYQLNNPDTHGPEAEFVRGWLVNGFHQDTEDNFWNCITENYLDELESSVDPRSGDVMGGKTWTVFNTSCAYVNFSDYEEGDFGVTYAFVRVHSPSDVTCQLRMGYDDGARVWLNGVDILKDNRCGGFVADMKDLNVSLNRGWNRLLVKVTEHGLAHGFSARFCQSDGSPVDGLSYYPDEPSVRHIGTWLMLGPFLNPRQDTRLTLDYLGGEAMVVPSEGEAGPGARVWERAIKHACPFNIGKLYDRGDWVLSEDIQSEDPPVLFYNLFACGPGRFTDNNYLAGAYIFNTTYGLITVASSKSGSMLYFDDFTRPLGNNECFGQAFKDWFRAQQPYEEWEKKWYYGMVLCGDPTLRLVPETVVCGDVDASGDIALADVLYLLRFIYEGGPAPVPYEAGDADCSGMVDVDDLIWLINFISSGGSAPCDTDGDGVPDC